MKLTTLIERDNVRADFKFGEARKPAAWNGAVNNWRVTLKRKGKRMSVDFYGGAGVTNPSAADVLSSLCLDANCGASFEDFCSECGYNQDSIQALKTYRASLVIERKLKSFLGEDFSEYCRAEH
jgi:hypothetical protein